MADIPNDPLTDVTLQPAFLLERRCYKTYLARLQACQRLARRNRAWNASLIALTTATTIASIGMLSDDHMYGDKGATLLVCVSTLTLVASLVTSGLDYSGRSKDMFVNYRKVQRIAVLAEAAKSDPSINVQELRDEYNELMDESENHTSGDHFRAQRQQSLVSTDTPPSRTAAIVLEDVLTYAPYVSLAVALALTIPLVVWFF